MLIRFGAIIAQASGSTGAVTFANTKGAPVMRVRPQRCNRCTPDQMNQQLAYNSAIAHWKALPIGTQYAWNLYAIKNQRQNRLGQWRRLTGMQFYLKEGIIRIAHGIPAPGSPPTYGQQGIGQPTAISFTNGGPYEIDFNSPVGDPHGWYIFSGHRPMSTTSYKKPYRRVLPAFYVEHAGSFDLYSAWCAALGDMAADELYLITVRYTGSNSLTSAPATWRATVG